LDFLFVDTIIIKWKFDRQRKTCGNDNQDWKQEKDLTVLPTISIMPQRLSRHYYTHHLPDCTFPFCTVY